MKNHIKLNLRVDNDELDVLRAALVELAVADFVKLGQSENENECARLNASIYRCRDLLAKIPISVESWKWHWN